MNRPLYIDVAQHPAGFSSALRLWKSLPDEIKQNDSGMPHIVLYDCPLAAARDLKESKSGNANWGDEYTLRIVVSVLKSGRKDLPRGLFWITTDQEEFLSLIRTLRV